MIKDRDEQFNAWWERQRDPLSEKRDAAKDAWDEAHKQRDEESNLIVGKGFWGKAVSNVSKENKLLQMHVEVLNRQLTNLQIYLQGPLSMGGGMLQRIIDGEHEVFINIATGDRLDGMGKHIGICRNGMPDADYRQLLRYEYHRRGKIK